MAGAVLDDWKDVWEELTAIERDRAMVALILRLRDPAARLDLLYNTTLHSVARSKRMRIETLKRMKNPQLAEVLVPLAAGLFRPREWTLLFLGYFADHKSAIMCRFLDLCEVPHDERGFVVGGDDRIRPPADMDACMRTMLEEFGPREVSLYFSVLRLMDARLWSFLDPVMPALLAAFVEFRAAREELPAAPAEDIAGKSASLVTGDDFTQLDRVILEQIIATAGAHERGLSPAELLDLVETVLALDATRRRSYFHLGFLDALLPDRDLDMQRQEMNDECRQWYLAGWLSGHARRGSVEAVREAIKRHGKIWRRAVTTPGGAGATLLADLLPFLLEQDMRQDATLLLRCQRRHLPLGLIERILEVATHCLREGDASLANVLLVDIKEGLAHAPVHADARRGLATAIERRLGQAMQAQGNFKGAREVLGPLTMDAQVCTPGLLADMGLVSGGFHSLEELLLADDGQRRRNMLAQLRQGALYFHDAVERFGRSATNAHYALSVMHCMDWLDGQESDQAREQALEHAQDALVGMMNDPSVQAYEDLGLMDRCRFMQAMLLMAGLEPGAARLAMAAWRAVADKAGQFPMAGLRRLIESADVLEPDLATEIAESIWRHRRQSALAIIDRPEWFARSPMLLAELTEACRAADDLPMERQWAMWRLLVPAALVAGQLGLAREGLDALEHLAQDSRFCEPMLALLDPHANVDPAWSQTDVLGARFRLYRRLGRDPEAFAQLRELFFALRDLRPQEAAQVLELFEECGAGQEYYADLYLPAQETEEDQDVESRLRQGARVNVLFVGGNEIQARYTEDLSRTLAQDWPGVHVEFRHTGWSSNWGREVEGLRRQAVEADAVVLMTMMRTTLGRALREALNDPPRPWVPCTGTGKMALLNSIRKAARVALANA